MSGQVANGYDTDWLPVIYHRQVAYPFTGHQSHTTLDRLLW